MGLLTNVVIYRYAFSLLHMLSSEKEKCRIVLQGVETSAKLFIGQVILKINLKCQNYVVIFHKTLYTKLKHHRLSQQLLGVDKLTSKVFRI